MKAGRNAGSVRVASQATGPGRCSIVREGEQNLGIYGSIDGEDLIRVGDEVLVF